MESCPAELTPAPPPPPSLTPRSPPPPRAASPIPFPSYSPICIGLGMANPSSLPLSDLGGHAARGVVIGLTLATAAFMKE